MNFKGKQKALVLGLVLLLGAAGRTDAEEFIAGGVVGLAIAGDLGYPAMSFFKFNECYAKSISFNQTDLRAVLDGQLFGEHIDDRVILNAVTRFMIRDSQKPLVLYFNGSTSTGKSLASKLIANHIYKNRTDIKCVHFFNAQLHFPNKSRIETYKSQLQQWIRGNVTNCANSMFIFDEMYEMHPSLIDTIKPLELNHTLDGVSYRKAIFIFLGIYDRNAEGKTINRTTLEFLLAGKTRHDLKMKSIAWNWILKYLFMFLCLSCAVLLFWFKFLPH